MRADARRNYERLVATARDVFTEQGPDAPLDDIARRAGVGPGTLYRHFPTREALVEAVYRGEIADLSARAYQLLEDFSPADALVAWLAEQVRFATLKRGLAATLKAVVDRDSETFAWCHTTLRDAAAAVVTRAQEAGAIRPDVTPTDVLRLCHGVAVATEHAPDDADRLLSVLLDGLRG
ncbi:TetR/AcrR family transcriptional regulator [Gandjariella thermophila]|nr:TetR/AcrR family transcriptional regulator [Gandjariella thermophila]